MTTQSKSACELYRFWVGQHYAAITVDPWWTVLGRKFGGEILVHSTLGNFGGTIEDCKMEFTEYLRGLTMQAFFEQFGGPMRPTFDGKASVAKLGKAILSQRRARSIGAETACELWGDLQFSADSAASSELSFRATAARICAAAPALGHPADHAVQTYAPQAQFFWDTLWPEFTAALARPAAGRRALAA
jgi:hypothetical protein